jgi:hypothetical protein
MSWINIQSCAGQTDMNWAKQLDMRWAGRQELDRTARHEIDRQTGMGWTDRQDSQRVDWR